MAIRATRRVAHHDKTILKQPETNDSLLAIVSALIFGFECRAGENMSRVLEVQAALGQCEFALGCVVGDSHDVNVATTIDSHKLQAKNRSHDAERPNSADAEP